MERISAFWKITKEGGNSEVMIIELKGKGCIDSTSVQDASTLVAVVDSSRCTEVVSHLAGNA